MPRTSTVILILILICLASAASFASAAQFQPMVGIPGLDTSGNYTLPQLINRLYIFLIAIGAVIGVIKIAFAGVKWATSVSGGSISAAKEDIKGVLLGLVILMVPYIVLSIINPNFTNLDVLKLQPLQLPQSRNYTSTVGGTAAGANGVCGACAAMVKDEVNAVACREYGQKCSDLLGTPTTTYSGTGDAMSFKITCNMGEGGLCPRGAGSTPAEDNKSKCEEMEPDGCNDCGFTGGFVVGDETLLCLEGYNCTSLKAACEAKGGSMNHTNSAKGWITDYGPADYCELPEDIADTECQNLPRPIKK